MKWNGEADRFATRALIPLPDYRRFVTSGDFKPRSLRAFAEAVGIDAGVVVDPRHPKKVALT